MNIIIVGKGPWGIALYNILRLSNNVFLKLKKSDNNANDNCSLLNYSDFKEKLDYIIFAVNSNSIDSAVSEYLDEANFKGTEIIIASKGLDNIKHTYLYDSLSKKGIEASFISGPNFAKELLLSKTSAMIASNSYERAKKIVKDLSSEKLQLHPTDDLKGVQICGAYKNICAIYFGYLNAKNESDNFKAKIFTQCLYELALIIQKLGGNSDTAYSYSGLGDMVLSCYSPKSRNFQLGYNLADSRSELVDYKLCEGILATKTLAIICKEFYCDLEILQKVVNLISNNRLL